jgi:NAD+ synthase (glutamine-hydrolysing)
VNASVPKTLVRTLVAFAASQHFDGAQDVLSDIIDTPISPELLPAASDGTILQVTEDVVGPYELHDFFLYNVMRWGFSPEKVLFLASKAFEGKYDAATVSKWLRVFYKRFFSQQFKRSCLPDGPKVGSVSLSPRGDWRMPSDALSTLWTD